MKRVMTRAVLTVGLGLAQASHFSAVALAQTAPTAAPQAAAPEAAAPKATAPEAGAPTPAPEATAADKTPAEAATVAEPTSAESSDAPSPGAGETPAELAPAPPLAKPAVGEEKKQKTPREARAASAKERRERRDQARAELEDTAPEAPAATLDNLGRYQNHLQFLLSIGSRTVSDPAFDAFNDADVLPMFGIGVGHTLLVEEQMSLVLTAMLSGGGTESTARGLETDLTVGRLSLSPEGRYHFVPQGYVYLRAAPVVTRLTAEVSDLSSDVQFRETMTLWGAEAGLGAAYAFFGERSGQKRRGRLWLRAELNGQLASNAELELRPRGDSAPRRAEPLDLGDLSLGGLGFDIAVALTF
jgi:hypothetical protein